MTERRYSKTEIDLKFENIENILSGLEEKIENGFDSINARLDKANGQMAKNTDFRLRTEGVVSFVKWLGAGNIVAWIVVLYNIFKQ